MVAFGRSSWDDANHRPVSHAGGGLRVTKIAADSLISADQSTDRADAVIELTEADLWPPGQWRTLHRLGYVGRLDMGSGGAGSATASVRESRMGLFDKLRRGLAKTREKVVGGFRGLLRGPISDDLLDRLEEQMLADDMGPSITTRLIDEVRDAWQAGQFQDAEQIAPFLKERIVSLWPESDRQLHFASTGPTVILVTGVNGAGKTTSIAKLGKWLTDQGKSVILGACDTYRAAAIEQLTVWSDRMGVQVVSHQHGADPGAVAYDACQAAVARHADVLLVDTAGRLHTQDHLMRELAKIQRVVERQIPGAPHEVLLVLDSTTGQNSLNQARVFSEHVAISGVILAKLDGSAKGGFVVGIREQLDIPVKFVGLGETLDDIEPFEPKRFVEALLEEEALA